MPESITTTTTTIVRMYSECDKCKESKTVTKVTTDGVESTFQDSNRKFDTYNSNVRCYACNALTLAESFTGREYTRKTKGPLISLLSDKLEILSSNIEWDDERVNPVKTISEVRFTIDKKVHTEYLSNQDLFRRHIGRMADQGWVQVKSDA